MFSFFKYQPHSFPSLRGSPLLSHIAKSGNSSNPDKKFANPLRICQVLSCPGHFAVVLGEGKTVILLDNVPSNDQSPFKSSPQERNPNEAKSYFDFPTSNQEVSVKLWNDIIAAVGESSTHTVSSSDQISSINGEMKQSISSSPTSSSLHSSIQQQEIKIAGKSINISSIKTNFSKFIQAGMNKLGIEQQQQQKQQQQNQQTKQSLQFISESPILCFTDLDMPFVTVFFEEREELNEDQDDLDVTRLYALQQNGNLWIWRYDEISLSWVKCGCKNIFITNSLSLPPSLSIIQHANFVPDLRLLVWTQIDEHTPMKNSGSVMAREIRFQKDDVNLGPAVKIASFGSLVPNPSMNTVSNAAISSTNTAPAPFHVGNNVWDLEISKTGIWLFTSNKIHHINLSNISTISSFKAKTLIARDIYVHIAKYLADNQKSVSNQEISNGSNDGNTNNKSNQNPTASIYEASEHENEWQKYSQFYYCSKYVHPLTKELVILGIDGIMRVCKYDTTSNSSSLETKQLGLMQTGIEEHINQFNIFTSIPSLNSAIQCQNMYPIQIFFSQQYMLCVTNQDVCMIYDPRMGVLLHQIQLPSDIILDDNRNQERNIVWNTYGTDMKCGVFSSCYIFELQGPPVSEILKESVELRQTAMKSQYHMRSSSISSKAQLQSNNKLKDPLELSELQYLATTAEHWNLKEWKEKFLLDLLIEDCQEETPASRVMPKQKQLIMKELCSTLENPSLVWTSTKSLSEQNEIIDTVSRFLQYFPAPDSSFWKKEQQRGLSMQLMNKYDNKQTKHGWRDMLQDISTSKDLAQMNANMSSRNTFHKLSSLNLTIIPTLGESLALSKEQLDSFQEYSKQKSNDVNIEKLSDNHETVSDFELYTHLSETEITQYIEDLTDIELIVAAKENPERVLLGICIICGLSPFVKSMKSKDDESLSKMLEGEIGEQIEQLSKTISCTLNSKYIINHEDDEYTAIMADSQILQSIYQPPSNENDTSTTTHFSSKKSNVLTPFSSQDNPFHSDSPSRIQQQAILEGCGILYFDILCNLLYEIHGGKYSWLICVLVVGMEKVRRRELEVEMKELEEKIAKLHSTEYQKKQNIIRLKMKLNYKHLYAQKALSIIRKAYQDGSLRTHANQKYRQSDQSYGSDYSKAQVQTVTRLLKWSNQELDALKLYLSKDLLNESIEVLQAILKHFEASTNTSKSFSSTDIDSSENSIPRENPHELVHVLLQYLFDQEKIDKPEQEKLWEMTCSFLQSISGNIFDILDTYQKLRVKKSHCSKQSENVQMENKKRSAIFVGDDKRHISVKSMLPCINSFLTSHTR